MSLTRIEIRNFQSLRQVDVDLGLFTVIVGPSSSGKSAFMRAFRALASNVRGSSVITRGQKAMAITGRTETHTVSLERSDRSGAYRLADHTGTAVSFTKLAGEVPEQITQVLRIDPVTERGSVNFASQFDKPYLLDESGAVIARHLGELTNVTRIFEAVRAANRVRSSAASALKTRKNDLEEVKHHLAGFARLSGQLSLLDEVEKLVERRNELQARAGRLDTALRTVRIAERAIEKATLPEVPSAEPLLMAFARYEELQARLRGQAANTQRHQQTQQDYLSGSERAEALTTELQELLQRTGVCPTCGQQTPTS